MTTIRRQLPTSRAFAPWLHVRLPGLLQDLLHAPAQQAPVTARPAALPDDLPGIEAEPPGACGWFDSSHELVHGLQVQELTSAESLAAALPLSAWLQWQLEGCSAVQTA